jgi:hypothetical protein
MSKTDASESVTLKVVMYEHSKLFEVVGDAALQQFPHIPVNLDMVGSHIEAKRGDTLIADFTVNSANTGILMAPPGLNVPQIPYVDGFIGKFNTLSVVGSSEFQAKDLQVGDTITVSAPGGKITQWLSGDQPPKKRKSAKVSPPTPPRTDFDPGEPQ